MATTVVEQDEPSVAERVAARVSSRARDLVLLVLVSCAVTLAPFPVDILASGAMTVLAWDWGRRR